MNNKNDLLLEMNEKLDKILNKIEEIDNKLNKMDNSCTNMDKHIDFIDGVYQQVKIPMDYAVSKVNMLISNKNTGNDNKLLK